MHQTTVHCITVVLRHVNPQSMGHPQAYGTVLQYFLAVLVSRVLVRPLVPTPEHPQRCLKLLYDVVLWLVTRAAAT
jgi:hypothetical protein